MKNTKSIKKYTTLDRCLIISDLDGTLLNSENKISKEAAKIIKTITARGHVFAIATGRPIWGSKNYYDDLDLKSIIVNYNGSYISNPSDPKFKPINLGFSVDIAKKILNNKKIHQWVNNIFVENTDGTFIWKKSEDEVQQAALFKHFHITDEAAIKYISKDLTNLKADTHSILIYIRDIKYLDDLMYQIKSLTNTLVVRTWSVRSTGTIVEINSIFSSKGMAIKYLSSYYGIPLENCLAFGDGDNDSDMLRTAHFGFAMKNGTTTAKLMARFMTQFTNNEDGVAQELKRFFNIKTNK